MRRGELWTLRFWSDAAERAVRAGAAAALAAVGGEQAGLVVLADWRAAAALGCSAGGLSLLMSLAAGRRGGSPGLATGSRRGRPLG